MIHKNITMPAINILVNVDDRYRNKLKTIAQKLQSVGMKVADVFPIAGTIAGEIPAGALSKVQKVEGVASVEEDSIFRAY